MSQGRRAAIVERHFEQEIGFHSQLSILDGASLKVISAELKGTSFSNCSLAFEQCFSHTWQWACTAYIEPYLESVPGVDSDLAQYLFVVGFQLRPEAVSRNTWQGVSASGRCTRSGDRTAMLVQLHVLLLFDVFIKFAVSLTLIVVWAGEGEGVYREVGRRNKGWRPVRRDTNFMSNAVPR